MADQEKALTLRERTGLRILAVMYRLVQPHTHPHQAHDAVREILREIQGTRDG